VPAQNGRSDELRLFRWEFAVDRLAVIPKHLCWRCLDGKLGVDGIVKLADLGDSVSVGGQRKLYSFSQQGRRAGTAIRRMRKGAWRTEKKRKRENVRLMLQLS
jgi:hypothetical protein